jgi:hypothetical protein
LHRYDGPRGRPCSKLTDRPGPGGHHARPRPGEAPARLPGLPGRRRLRRRLDPPEAGKAGTLAALQKVRDNLTALKASAGTQWGAQVTELDGAVDGFQATVAGIDGDSLLVDLPAIVGGLERIDTAWTALEGQIDQTCG